MSGRKYCLAWMEPVFQRLSLDTMSTDLSNRYPGVHFYSPSLTEVQAGVEIGLGSRVGAMALIHTGAVIGSGVTIGSHCNICDCRIGNNVSIQTACHITRGVVIEDDVFVGPGVMTLNDNFKGGPLSFPHIERGAKIGGGSTILPGVRIGAGAIVGAGSTVKNDVPAGAVVAGNPARINRTSAARPEPGRALRILMTTNSLASYAGSEVYLRDLAMALMKRGHFPVIYSTVLGEVAEELRTSTIPVVDDLDQLQTPPDIIHGQHHHETMTAVMRYPEVPAVSICHGWAPWEELPPVFPSIMRYVAVDDLCRERFLTTECIAPEKTTTIYNFVDLERFSRVRSLPATPKTALIYSNYAYQASTAIREACRRRGIERVDIVGLTSGAPNSRPEEFLPGYDIVFAKARSAIEAMASGCAVVVTDYAGLAGMVTPENFERWRVLNFGVRTMQANRLTVDAVEQEVARYDPTNVRRVSDLIRAQAGLADAVDRWIEVYHLALCDWTLEAPRHTSQDRLLAASRYMRMLAPRLKSLRLCEELCGNLEQERNALAEQLASHRLADDRAAKVEKTLADKSFELAEIHRSRSWEVLQRYRAIRHRLFPR